MGIRNLWSGCYPSDEEYNHCYCCGLDPKRHSMEREMELKLE